MTFKGLLLFLYNRLIKHVILSDKENRKSKYNNYKLLSQIFYNVYVPLCYKYSICPTILEFSCFVDVESTHLTDLRQGTYRGSGDRVNPETSQIVKKWYNVCESSLASRAISDNSIGSIFVLKSKYQWRETAPEPPQIETGMQSTPQQIMEKYQDAEKPELPVL